MSQVDAARKHARLPNSPISFQFDLVMDWKVVPFYFDDAIDGFALHLADPWSPMGRPIGVPGGMHAFIEMSRPTWKIDVTKCLHNKFPQLAFSYYDPRGYNCMAERMLRFTWQKYFNCDAAISNFLPNETNICAGSVMMAAKKFLSSGVGSVADNVNKRETKLVSTYHM